MVTFPPLRKTTRENQFRPRVMVESNEHDAVIYDPG